MRLRRSVLLPLAALAVLAGCDSSSGPDRRRPATLEVAAGDLQTATVGAQAPAALQVRVRDSRGRGVPDVPVSFAVTAGGGSLTAASAVTDADGVAETRWTLGTVARDTQRVEARVTPDPGDPPLVLVYRAVGTAAAPAAVAPVGGGTTRVGTVGAPLDSLALRVTDTYGNGVPAVPVVWTVRAGSATLSPANTTTGADGVARTRVTLGARLDSAAVVEGAIDMTRNVTFTVAPQAGPTSLTVTRLAGDGQAGTPGAALAQPLRVRVALADGTPVRGAVVTFTPSGGTAEPSTVATGADGEAETAWTLGAEAGVRTLTAAAPGGAQTVFTATTPAVGGLSLVKVAGDGRTIPQGSVTPIAVRVRVVDGSGAPVAGQTVTWSTAGGENGTITPATSVSDTAGEAGATWTPGSASQGGGRTARAQLGSGASATFSVTVGPPAGTPVLTVLSPANGEVTSGTMRIQATCAPCTQLVVTLPGLTVPNQTRTLTFGASVDSVVQVSARQDTARITFLARNGALESAVQTRSVAVVTDADLTRVVGAGTEALDYTPGRLVYWTESGGGQLRTRTVPGGADALVASGARSAFSGVYAFPAGVLYRTPAGAFEWRGGTSTSLPAPLTPNRTRTRAVGGAGGTIYLRDLAAGTTTAAATGTLRTPEPSEDGDFVLERAGAFFWYRGGAEVALDPTLQSDLFLGAVAGRDLFLYRYGERATGYTLRLVTPAGTTTLVSYADPSGLPGFGTSDGWVTWAEPGGNQNRFLRAPDGTVTPLGPGGTWGLLGPAGQLIVPTTDEWFLRRADGSQVGLGRPVGRGVWRDGLYLLVGNAVYRAPD